MAMEDATMLAADCVVLSCCCQCLILQILIFFFLKLPRWLVRKTKEYAKKKLRHRRRRRRRNKKSMGEVMEFHGGCCSGRIELKGFPFSMDDGGGGGGGDGGLGGCCMEEVERVLEEFSQRGEFAFGSFWGREGESSRRTSRRRSSTKEEVDFSVVQFEFVEIIASLC